MGELQTNQCMNISGGMHMKVGKYFSYAFVFIAIILVTSIDLLRDVKFANVSLFVVLTVLAYCSSVLISISFWALFFTKNKQLFVSHIQQISLNNTFFSISLSLTSLLVPVYLGAYAFSLQTVEAFQNVLVISILFMTPVPILFFLAPKNNTKILSGTNYLVGLISITFWFSDICNLSLYGQRAFGLVAPLFMAIAATQQVKKIPERLIPYAVLVATIQSESRTSIIAVTIIYSVSIFVNSKSSQKKLRYVFQKLLLAVLVSIFGFVSSSLTFSSSTTLENSDKGGVIARIDEVGDRGLKIGSIEVNTNGRSEAWGLLIENTENSSVIFGAGPGQASSYLRAVMGKEFNEPHNDYLRIYYDYGILGGLLVFSGMFVLGIAVIQNFIKRRVIFSLTAMYGLIGSGIMAITDNPIIAIFLIAPLSIVLALGLSYPAEESN